MQKRRFTRSGTWPDTGAIIKVRESNGYGRIQNTIVSGKVENLGCSGMFVVTDDFVPVPGYAEITIHFDSDQEKPDGFVKAFGRTVRLTKKGVGIRFTAINIKKLQKCIIKKINHSSSCECQPHPPA